ncbi:hypothetical protein LTR65_004827 [Meristemomyces frigidus]
MGNTGNAGAEETHWYKDTVLVMVDRAHVMPFILCAHADASYSGRKDIGPLLNRCIHDVRTQPHVVQYKSSLDQVCEFITGANEDAHRMKARYRSTGSFYPNDVVVKVIESSILFRNVANPQRVVLCASGKLPISAFEAMGTLLGVAPFAMLEYALTGALARHSTLYAKARMLDALFGGDLRNRSGAAAGWAEKLLLQATKEIKQVTEDDGEALADVAICFNDEELLRTVIMPTVMANTSQTLFAVGFLFCWGHNAEAVFQQHTFHSVFDQVWSPMLADFQIVPKPPPPAVARLLFVLDKQGLPDELHALVTSIVRRSLPGAKGDVLLSVWMRVINSLAPLAVLKLHDSIGLFYKLLYQHILRTFVKTYVGLQPTPHRGWARPRLACGCRACWPVNLFLASITQQTETFSAQKDDRYHLHCMLDDSGFDGTHETKRTYREPQILVVTKRDRVKGKYDAWVGRCRKAYDEIQKFDQDGLRQLLGAELYEEIVEMRSVCLHAMDAPGLEFLNRRQPVQEVRNSPAPPPAAPAAPLARVGVKRKAAVIDLSGDSD